MSTMQLLHSTSQDYDNSENDFTSFMTAANSAEDAPIISPQFRSEKLEWLYGNSHELTQDFQLCLLMQPNCPGCILHSMPTVNALASSKLNFDVYVVATAFEDFEYNTAESARRLLAGGTLVGASAEKLGRSFLKEAAPKVPFAIDNIVDRENASPELKNLVQSAMLANARDQLERMNVPQEVTQKIMAKVKREKVLPAKISELFWTVRAQGTPTWIVHRSNGEVLDVAFGHKEENEIQAWIHELVKIQLTKL